MSRRRKTTASGTERRAGRLRLAAVVYGVVVILGLAGTGAHALWSQSGTVASSVTTGTWGPQPVTAIACSGKIDWYLDTDTLVVTYTAPESADEVEVTVAKGSTLADRSRQKVVPGRQYNTDLSVPLRTESKDTFNLTVTPYAQGVAGQPATRTVVMQNSMLKVHVTCS